jgi:hypothetical protein
MGQSNKTHSTNYKSTSNIWKLVNWYSEFHQLKQKKFNARRSHTFGLGQKQRSFWNTKVDTKKIRITVCKEQQISWFKVAGQYQRLTNASIEKSIKNNTATAEPVPIVNQLMLGQVNASLPIFAGFKIKTALKPTITCIRQKQRHAN